MKLGSFELQGWPSRAILFILIVTIFVARVPTYAHLNDRDGHRLGRFSNFPFLETTSVSRTGLWLLSGWECRSQHLSTAPGSPGRSAARRQSLRTAAQRVRAASAPASRS